MDPETVTLSVPTTPAYARSVRMLAANLAVVAGLSIDDVEDVRMAAEEAFVLASQGDLDTLEARFEVAEERLTMAFELGEGATLAPEAAEDEEAVSYSELILAATADDYALDEGTGTLTITKSLGVLSELD